MLAEYVDSGSNQLNDNNECLSYQVLKNWLDRKRAASVQGLIRTIRHWEKDGYINDEVWEKLRDKVDLDSIQSEETAGMAAIVSGM